MSRVMIAGTNSGCGKTTVTCALLSALKARGLAPTAFKCGPDFIDPMFHRKALNVPSYNLDPFFTDGSSLRGHMAAHGGAPAVIEAAMGYYDGVASTTGASAHTVAVETNTPVVLVVDARGAAASLGAVLEGFLRYRENSLIAGVIFNNAAAGRYPDLKRIAADAGVKAYGHIPRKKEWELPGRHLGLLTAGEIADLDKILEELGAQAEKTVDMDGLLDLARTAPALAGVPTRENSPQAARKLRLAVARDEAFCFIYEENLELLRRFGCEPVFFSPVTDAAIQPDVCGLVLPGGYPELHTGALSRNRSMLASIKEAIEAGLPTVAECGGFLYLHETLDGSPMCGAINARAYGTMRLGRFGYITLTAKRDNLLCAAGESVRAHEFHYWESDSPGDDFTAKKAGREISYGCIHATNSLYAGFPHLYFPANPAFAANFIQRMSEYEPY